MGTSYFFVDDNIFPLVRYGRPPENYHYRDDRITNRAGPEMYVQVATATDQSLILWSIEGSVKTGRVEFRDYEYDGSLKTVKFVDGVCIAYGEESNPDSIMLPRLISLSIIPATLTYDGY